MTDSLLASLESAERGDRKLDWLIHSTIAEPWNEGRKWSPFGYVDVDGHPPHPDEICIESPEGKSHYNHMPRYTDSVDAALALAERVLPEMFWTLGFLPDAEDPAWDEHHNNFAALHPYLHVADPRDVTAYGATPALAMCAAILRATQSRSTPEDGKGG
jgi:hypothetical protein